VAVTFSEGGWYELFSYPDGALYDLSEFEEFHFSFRGNGVFTTKFIIEFIEGPFEDRKQITIDGVSETWQEKSVDLKTELSGLDLTRMRQFAIVLKFDSVSQKIGTLYFDNFYFVDKDEGYNSNDEFLDLVSKKAFKYFIDNTHPSTGLILDKASLHDVSSIAAVGFGLTSLGIGAERGWVTREDAAMRTQKILETLYNASQGSGSSGYAGYKGFFYHLLDISTAVRDGNSELSSVDTALLLAGVLFSREYFADEVEIRNLADSIYNRVDWNWMLDTDKNQFRMEWKPNSGFGGHWDYYTDEVSLICILAVASGKVDSDVFYAWKREQGTYGNYTFYQTYWGSLFTYFFAHCWINFKDFGADSHPTIPVNWWENSTLAVKANRQFCIDSSSTYATYGDNSWGLTACLGPNGYNGGNDSNGKPKKSYGALPLKDPPANHDGTIPPYGAGSSIIFFSSDPEQNESVQALKNYYTNYPKLWGLYAFKDAYNLGKASDPTDDWYADEYFGIDVGSMLLMIENYRTGLVWNYFMQNNQIKEALKKIITTVETNPSSLPGNFALSQNYPNPFNPATTIRYSLPEAGGVQLIIYDELGRLVRRLVNKEQLAGEYAVVWDGKNDSGKLVASGTYFYTLKVGNNTLISKRMLMIK
jgi:hypothetical protein